MPSCLSRQSTIALFRGAEKCHRLGLATVGQNSFGHIPAAAIGASIGSTGTAVAQQSLRAVLGLCNAPADDRHSQCSQADPLQVRQQCTERDVYKPSGATVSVLPGQGEAHAQRDCMQRFGYTFQIIVREIAGRSATGGWSAMTGTANDRRPAASSVVLGVDIGTTSTKVVGFDPTGRA